MNVKGNKISIIGAGFVGSTAAYALMMSGLASEIVIVDINKEKAEGEALDLSHGESFVKPVDIISGDYSDTKDSDIVIITAGISIKQGQTRLDIIQKNLGIFKVMIPEIVRYNPHAVLLVVSNPVDVLSYITYKLSGFPKERVIGSGTVLDTSRLRFGLSRHFDVDIRNIHTYIMGEHGDSEFAAWSLTSIAGMDIEEYCRNSGTACDNSIKENLLLEVKNAGYEIVQKKGATNYAVALAVRRITEAILRNENSILTVSNLLTGQYGLNDIYMGIPAIVGSQGVKRALEVPLNDSENSKMISSYKALNEVIKSINI